MLENAWVQTAGGLAPRCRSDSQGKVYVNLEVGGGVLDTVIATLPASMAPTIEISLPVVTLDNSGVATFGVVFFATDGTITLKKGDTFRAVVSIFMSRG